MYLTRVRLNPQRAKTIEALRNPQILHAAVLAGMPTQPVPIDDSGRVLWRVDPDNPYQPLLFSLSPERPDMTHLVEQFGWPEADTVQFESRVYAPVLAAAVDGAHFTFRLTANPTHTGRDPDGNPKRYAHVTAAQQTDWLASRAERNGFTITENSIGQPSLEILMRERTTFKRGEHKVTLRRVTYQGRLAVTDHQSFRRTLTHGIGKAKAYGCGLLTLAP